MGVLGKGRGSWVGGLDTAGSLSARWIEQGGEGLCALRADRGVRRCKVCGGPQSSRTVPLLTGRARLDADRDQHLQRWGGRPLQPGHRGELHVWAQISFSAAPALKDCSRGPFSAVILNWVTSHPFLQHLPLKFQWFFTDVCRVVSSFFHSMCDPLKAGLSRPHLSLQSQTKKLSQRQLRLAN